jgi:hypothetical protein
VTVFAAMPSSSEPSVAAYENLRRHVLAGTAFGGRFGLILILQEGVAAWVSRCATSSASLEPARDAEPCAAAPKVSDGMRASVVQVLASMVFRGLGGTSS